MNAISEFHKVADRTAFIKQFARRVKRNFKVNFPEYSSNCSLASVLYCGHFLRYVSELRWVYGH